MKEKTKVQENIEELVTNGRGFHDSFNKYRKKVGRKLRKRRIEDKIEEMYEREDNSESYKYYN